MSKQQTHSRCLPTLVVYLNLQPLISIMNIQYDLCGESNKCSMGNPSDIDLRSDTQERNSTKGRTTLYSRAGSQLIIFLIYTDLITEKSG